MHGQRFWWKALKDCVLEIKWEYKWKVRTGQLFLYSLSLGDIFVRHVVLE